MILLWGMDRDTPLAAVRTALERMDAPFLYIDQRAVLNLAVELYIGKTVAGTIITPTQRIDLDTVTAIYLRGYNALRLSTIEQAGEGSAAWQHVVHVDDTFYAWVELTSALVINRPSDMASNNSKPYQSRLIQQAGFAVPDTLITTNVAAVRAFQRQHGTIIYKSISGIRSIVSRLTAAHEERLAQVQWCPTQFQQYIPGIDYRVHVVGTDLFACEVCSEADDYRYATRQGSTAHLTACTLPEEIAQRCLSLAQVTHMYCFEVNPSPAFPYFQHETGHAIDVAIAQLLASTLSL
jgi:hypothetical protein